MKKIATILFSLIGMLACTSNVQLQLNDAESLIMTQPDSAQKILENIPQENITSAKDRALYDMLYTWALFRNYAKEIPEEPLENAFEYFKESSDAQRKAQVLYLHSVVEEDQKRGDPGVWLKDLYEACIAIEQCEDYVLAAKIYQRYAGKKYDAQDHKESLKWNRKYVDAARKTGNPKEITTAMINLALSQTYSERDSLQNILNTKDGAEIARHTKFEKGFSSLSEALKIAKENKLATEEGKIYGNLAIFYSYRQMPDSTLAYALKAVKIDEQQFAKGERRDPVRYVHVCDAYRKLGNADSAIYYGLKDVNYPHLLTRRNAAQLLYCTYSELKNDYKNSLYWLQRYKAIEDSIHQGLESQQFNATEAAAEQKIETEKAKAEVHKSRSWLIWVIIVTCLFVGLAFYIIVNNRRKYFKHLKLQEEEINRLLRAAENAKQLAESQEKVNATKQHTTETVENAYTDKESLLTREQANTSDSGNVKESEKEEEVIKAPTISEEFITLAGNTKEELKINPKDILYLTSEGNYIKVAYMDAEKKVKSKMIRQTMTAISATLKESQIITRCHRAFFVNLKHVSHASIVPAGLMLTLDKSSTIIPVSRSYISVIKEKLQNNI